MWGLHMVLKLLIFFGSCSGTSQAVGSELRPNWKELDPTKLEMEIRVLNLGLRRVEA